MAIEAIDVIGNETTVRMDLKSNCVNNVEFRIPQFSRIIPRIFIRCLAVPKEPATERQAGFCTSGGHMSLYAILQILFGVWLAAFGIGVKR